MTWKHDMKAGRSTANIIPELIAVARAQILAQEPKVKLASTGKIFGLAPKNPKVKTAASTGNKESVYTQYVDKGNSMRPIDDVRLEPKLRAGIYHIVPSMEGIFFERQRVNTDSLLKFEDPIHKEILSEMEDFWARREKYEKKGFLHNRAVLMFGPPGSGKSCLIKIAMDDLTKSGDVVFVCKNSIHTLNEGLKHFREIEPDRRCLAVIEDVDELDEHSLLQLLDGTDTADHILFLATTNYVNRLPERVLRPGRFDRKIEVPHPPHAGRKAYLESKLGEESLNPEQIEVLIKATDGFSFGHLRELVTAVFCMGQPLGTVIKRLKGSGLEMHTPLPKKSRQTEKYYESKSALGPDDADDEPSPKCPSTSFYQAGVNNYKAIMKHVGRKGN